MFFSLGVAFVVAPWAALRLLAHDHAVASDRPRETWSTRAYRRTIRKLLHSARARLGFLALIVALFAGAVALVGIGFVRVKMLPFDNKSEFQVFVDLPAGASAGTGAGGGPAAGPGPPRRPGRGVGAGALAHPGADDLRGHGAPQLPPRRPGAGGPGRPARRQAAALAVQPSDCHRAPAGAHRDHRAARGPPAAGGDPPRSAGARHPGGGDLRPKRRRARRLRRPGPRGLPHHRRGGGRRLVPRAGHPTAWCSRWTASRRRCRAWTRRRSSRRWRSPSRRPRWERCASTAGRPGCPSCSGSPPRSGRGSSDLLQIPVHGERGAVPLETLVRPVEVPGEPRFHKNLVPVSYVLAELSGKRGEPGLRARRR